MTNRVRLGSNPDVFERSVGLQLSYLSPIFSGLLRKCDAKISSFQHALSLLPRSTPTHASYVYRLATGRLVRYLLSHQQDDLEQSILGFTEAILSLPHPLPFPNINQAFHCLTLAISLRAVESSHPEDVKYSVIYLRYLRGLPHDVHYFLPFPVTPRLVGLLAIEAELETGDVNQDIEEMVGLCDGLLDSDISTDDLAGPIMLFAVTVDARREESSGVNFPSEKVIGCLRKVIIRLPDSVVSIVLAKCLLRRFERTISDDDYNEGMAILGKVIDFRGPGDTPSPYKAEALKPAIQFSRFRFLMSGKPEHLEQAIYLNRTLLDVLSLEHPDRDYFIGLHSTLQGLRFDGTDVVPKSETGTSESAGRVPSFRDLTASLLELSAKPIPETILNQHRNALDPSIINCLTDIADIEDGINYVQQFIASYPDHRLVPVSRCVLCCLLRGAFACTNKIEYLNRAISEARDSLNTSNSRVAHILSLGVLIPSLLTRLSLLERKEDFNEIIELFPIAPENISQEFHLLPLLCQWASVARFFGHSSVSAAYDRAMSSMQACLTLSPTLDTQHS